MLQGDEDPQCQHRPRCTEPLRTTWTEESLEFDESVHQWTF